MAFIKIGALALVGVMLGIQLKSTKQEYGLILGIALCALIFSCTVTYMGQVKGQLSVFEKYLSSGERYFSLLFKVVGITWICEFVSGICKDSGFSAVATQMELFGKIAVLFAGFPVFLALIETIAGFAG
ncbi:MAG: stage III sporulation AC/AD family protein [Lachnospiraceae bacterium]|nr:stage III sporulation AC/AD family protein [Lachnospiraceae bacterium]